MKKRCLAILPLIFIILIFIPGLILETASHDFQQGMPDALSNLVFTIKWILIILWAALFYYIPLGVYTVLVFFYTGITWGWLFKQKKGNVAFAVLWLVLCILSILMYWKIGPLYHAIMNG